LRYDSLPEFIQTRRSGARAFASVVFALGVLAGVATKSALTSHAIASFSPALTAPQHRDLPAAWSAPSSGPSAITYPAEVLRIIDGDTFEAEVHVWPGLGVDTKVRLRGIDAAELHARCNAELVQARAAQAALENMLAEGGVTLSRVGLDKYAGRVDAAVATRSIADVSAALLKGGFARAYDGGRRGSWCSAIRDQ
jgi:endonuclease YncB( thermonuclease family)